MRSKKAAETTKLCYQLLLEWSSLLLGWQAFSERQVLYIAFILAALLLKVLF